MRIGVLGGTFDPPHLGHLLLAEHAREQLLLDQVVWVPASDPPHKQGFVISPVQHRIEMVRCSIQDNEDFGLSLVDVERPGPHFSVDMLALLASQYANAELFFLIGGDSLRDFPQWHEPHNILIQARLIVMDRPGPSLDLTSLEADFPEVKDRVTVLETPLIDISGNAIRKKAQAGRSFRYMVPDSVRAYILQHNLYRKLPLE